MQFPMSGGDEQNIIKQYQPLIRALIPYEQENRLLEGLNKFSTRLPSSIRRVVKEEVIRLTSLTDAPADNSAFAQFPVMKFKHFGIPMRLDKVGARILKDETSLYQNRYTVGVFESVMNSSTYQTQIKKEQYKKIVDAFAIETQSVNDIDFGDDIALSPNFPVSSQEFEKGRHCNVSSLAFDTMAVETKRPPTISTGDEILFTFPDVMGLNLPDPEVKFTLTAVKFNKNTNKYDSHFTLTDPLSPQVREAIKKYIEATAYKQPLKRDLEVERAMQDLERDRILENSPWLPLFVHATNKGVTPVIALLTKANIRHSHAYRLLDNLSGKSLFTRLCKELNKYHEAYVFHGVVKTRKGPVEVAMTHRQLMESGQLSAYIYLLSKSGKLSCTQCRLEDISQLDRDKAFSIHDINRKQFTELGELNRIVYCRDVSDKLDRLTLGEKCDFKAIPRSFLVSEDRWRIGYVMEEELDRRSETRYVVDKAASIKVGLLSSINARVCDLSAKGLQLSITPGQHSISDEVRVTVPELRIKNEKYRVVNFNATTGTLRLCLQDLTKLAKTGASVEAMVEENSAFYKMRDVAKIQRLTHRFIWELAIRHMPSLSVLCVLNRNLLDRLKTVYQGDNSDDIYPFSQAKNITPLHGFFADRDVTKPKSKMLERLFKGNSQSASVVHCVRNTDSKLIFIKNKDFMYGTLRQQIAQKLQDQKVQLCVTDITAIRCQSHSTPLTRKRLAQLSKIDKATYDKLHKMQEGYTHVIYVTNLSSLQNDLVTANLRHIPPASEVDPAHGAA